MSEIIVGMLLQYTNSVNPKIFMFISALEALLEVLFKIND